MSEAVKEPHIAMWLEATLNMHGDDTASARRWKMVTEVLKALGCSDIVLRETERSAGNQIRCMECRAKALEAAARRPDPTPPAAAAEDGER